MVINPNAPDYPAMGNPWYEARQHYLEEAENHIGHRKHLCNIVEDSILTLDQVKALVKDAKFICKKCGRVATKEENLCEPVPL